MPETRHQKRWTPSLRVGLAMAAGIALFFSVTLSLWPKTKISAAHSSLADLVIGDAQHPKTHGGHGDEAVALNRTLNQLTTRLSDRLPVDFASLRSTGCRTLHLEGRDVLEVCFKRNGVGLHYYVARREDFPTLTAPGVPTVVDKTEGSIVTWADAAHLYLVVTKLKNPALEKLL